LARAASDGTSGVTARSPGSPNFAKIARGGKILAGSTVRTDDRTRAVLTLDDGSQLSLNHLTEISLAAAQPRQVELATGELVADVAHLQHGPTAVFSTPHGHVEVIGTRFQLVAAADQTSVRVTRGLVRIHGAGPLSRSAEVRPGEEGLVGKSGIPEVSPVSNLAQAVAWTDLMIEGPEHTAEESSGLGQLRAYKPGESRDRDWRLALADHKVKVRIAGNVARTEIEETFRNSENVTLEGVYQFPLPADARIDELALDVNGKFVAGAFVEKERAGKIWRGVIDRATPKKQRIASDVVWVPGPWRDPALLEWQRGGRFELRIFPIPKRGKRTVRLAYTQVLAPEGKLRRYIYPLAHPADGSTAADRFEVDIKLSGVDQNSALRARGYELARSDEGGQPRFSMARDKFVPSGDLVVEYGLPDAEAELRAWTFAGAVAAAPKLEHGGQGKRGGADPELIAEQERVAADARPTALIALRPHLPRWTAARRRDYAIAVDSSQSMFGERYTRATELALSLIAEMDRNDRFVLLACDVTCRSMSTQAMSPSEHSVADARAWLSGVEPGGASDITGALAGAAGLLRPSDERDAWVLYVGDGMASVGPRQAGGVSAAVADLAAKSHVSFTAVGLGGDADEATLAAIARAGGGYYVRYRPGRRAQAAALAVLETTYGVSLRNATLRLPSGMTDVAPSVLPTLRAGDEFLIAARFEGEVRGDVVLEGTVGGEKYENRFPIRLTASNAAGNSFVPRMWASLEIERLDLQGRAEERRRAAALSKAYGVLSRQTSLLVLESEAMFRAFGVDQNRPAVRWTGEEGDVEVVESVGRRDYQGPAPAGHRGLDADDALEGVASGGVMDKSERKAKKADAEWSGRRLSVSRSPQPPGHWMRRVWHRSGSIAETQFSSVPDRVLATAERAQAALEKEPNSRERHRQLVQALSYAGDLERAEKVARAWLSRDPLDPQALISIADLAARGGDRERALRLLSGVVDLQPDQAALHERLATAYERVGYGERACAHRVALAELSSSDGAAVGAAVRCLREFDHRAVADWLLSAANASARTQAEEIAAHPAGFEVPHGELLLDAHWEGDADVDIGVIAPDGTRISWMGGRRGVSASDVNRGVSERMALRRISAGGYWIEVSRATRGDNTPVRGTVEVTVLGKKKQLRFQLDRQRAIVGQVQVTRYSQLVPI
jgi:ferric-dicitrate binding protein FerR (iron transport regulator)/Mg-chelatase subunit ChlD